MRFRHVIIIILIIVLVIMLLYSNRISRNKTIDVKGGGADDIAKQIIGMFIGSLEKPELVYYKERILTITTTSKDNFNVFYDSLNNLSDDLIKTSKKVINVEFNETYKIRHRIKNIYTSLMLILTIIQLKYQKTGRSLVKLEVTYNSSNKKYEYNFKIGSKTELELRKDYEPFTIRFVNINYDSTNDLIDYLNIEKEPFKILNPLVFKYILNTTVDPYSSNTIGEHDNSVVIDDLIRPSQGYYGYNLNLKPSSTNEYTLTNSLSPYGFNYIDIQFGNVFKFDEFGNIIEKICEVNNISRDFIHEIIENHNDPNYTYYPIKDDDKTGFSDSSYTYFNKLVILIDLLQVNKSMLKTIVETTFQVNPDLLIFDE